MENGQLLEMTRSLVEHAKAGTLAQADDVLSVPASDYTDPKRFAFCAVSVRFQSPDQERDNRRRCSVM